MKNDPSKDSEIKAAAHLAMVEIVAGSVGHGFKIPFTGTLLSYYQLYISLWLIIVVRAPRSQVFNVSVIVALLKTLSPFGKKITPMIAISMQGFLLWLGLMILGNGWLGLALGALLFVSWSILQIAIGYVLVYGFDFLRMVEYFQHEIREYSSLNMYAVLIGYWCLKVLVALVLVLYLKRRERSHVWMIDEDALIKLKQKVIGSSRTVTRSDFKKALYDLVNPFFVLSLALMILFHFYKDTSQMQILWFICRSLGVAFLLFYLVRSEGIRRCVVRIFNNNRYFRRLYGKMYKVKRHVFSQGTPPRTEELK